MDKPTSDTKATGSSAVSSPGGGTGASTGTVAGGRSRTGSGGRATSPATIPEFTEEDYILYLEHPAWTKEDTLSLLDAVRIFDFEWSLVASTFHGDSRKTPSVRPFPGPIPFPFAPQSTFYKLYIFYSSTFMFASWACLFPF
jgi:hypothetical protein